MAVKRNKKYRRKHQEALQWCRENDIRTEYKRGRIRLHYKNGDKVKTGRNLIQLVKKMKKEVKKNQK